MLMQVHPWLKKTIPFWCVMLTMGKSVYVEAESIWEISETSSFNIKSKGDSREHNSKLIPFMPSSTESK